MTVAGNWTLHYSWGSTGSYAQTSIVFNGNGTFGGSFTGQWRQQAGTLMLSFDSGPAKYGGNVNSNIGTGAMSTFSGLDGSWYLSKDGTTGIALVVAEIAGVQPAGPDGTATKAAEELVGTPELAGDGSR
jgi:hypothetical protein